MFKSIFKKKSAFYIFVFNSKAVSTDHNKPIIIPAGQDTFINIGKKYFL